MLRAKKGFLDSFLGPPTLIITGHVVVIAGIVIVVQAALNNDASLAIAGGIYLLLGGVMIDYFGQRRQVLKQKEMQGIQIIPLVG